MTDHAPIDLVPANGGFVVKQPEPINAPDVGTNVIARHLAEKAPLYGATDPKLAEYLKLVATEIVATTNDPAQQLAAMKLLGDYIGATAKTRVPPPGGPRQLHTETLALLEGMGGEA